MTKKSNAAIPYLNGTLNYQGCHKIPSFHSYNDHDTKQFLSSQAVKGSDILTEKSWERRPTEIPSPTDGACAIQLDPIQFMFIGGNTQLQKWRGTQTYIVNKDATVKDGPPLQTPRIDHSCAKLDSSYPGDKPRVIAIGGWNPQEMLSTTESLNEELMQWEDGRCFRQITTQNET